MDNLRWDQLGASVDLYLNLASLLTATAKTTGAFSRNVGKVIFWTKVGNR